jgi:hypothetical protein
MNGVFNECYKWKEMAEKARDIRADALLAEKKKASGGSAQVLEKARNRQENPRKSKHFPLIDLAGFGRA